MPSRAGSDPTSPRSSRKGHQEVVAAARASGPGEAVGQDAALEVAPELPLAVSRYAVTHGIGLIGQEVVMVFSTNIGNAPIRDVPMRVLGILLGQA